MTTTELEAVIRDYIRDIYHKEYIGKMWIDKLEPIGYCVRLGMNVPEKPITIYAELNDDAFVKFIKQDLKDRRFNLVDFGELKLTYPVDCTSIDNKCECQKRN